MAAPFKNKSLSLLLASLFGGIGLHRFYLFGKNDYWGWAHFITLPISLLALYIGAPRPWLFLAGFLVASILAGFIEALVIGTTPDEKWDARHNAGSARKSDSGWPLVFMLVLTLGVGAIGAIWVMARTFDLVLTGGAYG
jgi:hypothetical protein